MHKIINIIEKWGVNVMFYSRWKYIRSVYFSFEPLNALAFGSGLTYRLQNT